MSRVDASRLTFLTEWLDPNSGVVWSYNMFFFPETNEVELIDMKNHKTFLKRSYCDTIRGENLYVGQICVVFARQLKIISLGDPYTKRQLEAKSERTLAMIKPDAYKHLGKVLTAIAGAGFSINNMRSCQLTKTQAEAFYGCHAGKPFFEKLTTFMSSGRIVALELVAEQAIAKWRELIGPTNSDTARQSAPDSIRARFGTDGSYNAVHGSDAPDTAAEEIAFFFSNPTVFPCALGADTTLCVVKPHTVAEGLAGYVLDLVSESFEVTALKLLKVDPRTAAEFYDVYKGVMAAGEYEAMVSELTSGPCIAAELALKGGSHGESAVQPLRELCGPSDPELAAVLRPHSLRAQFGVSKVRNAVHCTDLAEDGTLEVDYMMSL